MKLNRAPYRVVAGQPPDSVANDMVSAFEAVDVYADKVGRVFTTLMIRTGITAGNPLMIAGQRLAAHIDAGGAGGHQHPYHHRRHLCEVMLGANFLARLHALSDPLVAEVILAALIHDYAHDGKPNGAVAFRLERQSVKLTEPVLASATVPAWQRQRLAALVLSTDVASGHKIALDCYRGHRSSAHAVGPTEAAMLAAAPELITLRNDPQVALQALILCEADVLPSVGLTTAHAVKLQKDLAAEWGQPLDARDKLRFIDEWFRRCVTSDFFKPNVQRLHDELTRSLSEGEAQQRSQQLRRAKSSCAAGTSSTGPRGPLGDAASRFADSRSPRADHDA